MQNLLISSTRFAANPKGTGEIWAHFVAGRRLVYVKYTAAPAV